MSLAAPRKIGPLTVQPIGFGCMSLSHGYGTPPPVEHGRAMLHRALDLGYDLLDTSALYGFGANETLIGEALSERRGDYSLSSKAGLGGAPDGSRVVDGRPEALKKTLDEALIRLQTDVIDLYYLHRVDKNVPVEESVGALADMVAAGKVRAIGLSEVSAATLRRAHAVHPIAAVQNEYSPWSRNVELGVLEACRELGTALVAFAPTARGFLAGAVTNVTTLDDKDMRRSMPRFSGDNLEHNLGLYARFEGIAAELGCTTAQLSIAWLLTRGDHVVPIPGTSSFKHLEENFGARDVAITPDIAAEIDGFMTPDAIAGERYSQAGFADIDTESY